MRTNAAVDINTNWQINGIVKPNHVNALTRSIKYDYVLTAQMLEDKTGNVDVFDLLNLGINQGTLVPGDTHILINTPVPDDVVLKFPGNQAGPSGHFNIHIYALGAFKADCTGTSPMISFFFHTHGTSGAVTLLGLGADVYVGSFALESALVLPIHYASFTYEMALGELPTLPEMGGTIRKAAWMSNATGAGGGGRSNVLKLCAYGLPYDIFDVDPSYTDPEDIDGRALDLEGYDSVEWFTNLACEDHVEAEHGIHLDAPFESYSGSIISDAKPNAYVNPENCKGTGASFTIKSKGALPIEDGAPVEFDLIGDFSATGLSGGFSVRYDGTIKYTGVTISGANAATTINGGVATDGSISGTFSGQIDSGGISGDALSFGFAPAFSGKISGSITSGAPSTGASLSGTGTIQILDGASRPVITLNVTNGAITSGEINEAEVTQRGSTSGGTDSSNLPRVTKFIPARYLTIDPDTMVEGKVYPIHVKCWNRGDIMSFNLLLNGVSYPVYVYSSSAGIPETVDAFSKFGYDADGFYTIDRNNHKFSIKTFDGSPLDWTEASFEMNMTTTPASGFEPLKASGVHNDGNNHSTTFTALYPDTPGASFTLFEIRILNSGVYLLNNVGAGHVRPKMVTVAPPGGSLWGQCESPAPYAGTVYLMKKNGKVYALGY